MNKRELAKVYSEMSNGEISERKALKEIDIFLETVKYYQDYCYWIKKCKYWS